MYIILFSKILQPLKIDIAIEEKPYYVISKVGNTDHALFTTLFQIKIKWTFGE